MAIISKGQLRNEDGDAIQLKGVSSMWLNWDPAGYALDKEGMRFMRDNWGMKIFRAAMGAALPPDVVAQDDTHAGNPTLAESQVRTIIENAIELGVYVLVDWHDHEALGRQATAQAFFQMIAAAPSRPMPPNSAWGQASKSAGESAFEPST